MTGSDIFSLIFFDFFEIALFNGFGVCKIISQLHDLGCDALKILFLERTAAENPRLFSIRLNRENLELDDARDFLVFGLDNSALRLRLTRRLILLHPALRHRHLHLFELRVSKEELSLPCDLIDGVVSGKMKIDNQR